MENATCDEVPETSNEDQELGKLEGLIEDAQKQLVHLQDRRKELLGKQQAARHEELVGEINKHLAKTSRGHVTIGMMDGEPVFHLLPVDFEEGEIDSIISMTRAFMNTNPFVELVLKLSHKHLCLIMDNHGEYDALISRVPLASCIGCSCECTIFTTGKEEGGGPLCTADIMLDPDNAGRITPPNSTYCPYGNGGKWISWQINQE